MTRVIKRTGKGPGRPKRRDEMVGPTRETVAKLQADVLLVMVEAGVLTLEQERAGREIAEVWRALMRGFFGTFNPDGARSSGRVREPVDSMTHGEARMFGATYLPWAKRETKNLVVKFPKLTRADLAYRICAVNQAPEHIAREFCVDRFALITPLRDTLDAYARLMSAREMERRRVG